MIHLIRRRVTAWLVLLGVSLSMLAPWTGPALSRALAGPALWQQVCTVHADKAAVFQTNSGEPVPDGSHDLNDHCSYCLLDPVNLALPPMDARVAMVQPVPVPLPADTDRTWVARIGWISPLSRAPPA